MSTNNSNSSSSSGGVGIAGVLFIVFLVLKLTGNINWSWWWVTSPIWIPLGLVAAFGLVALGAYGIAKLLTKKRKVKK